jgi:hypothetical protein
MKKKWYHLIFVVVVGSVFLVLWRAPAVKTPRLPETPDHADRKQFERCPACHGPGSEKPMPNKGDRTHYDATGTLRADHLKCYFCHKPKSS